MSEPAWNRQQLWGAYDRQRTPRERRRVSIVVIALWLALVAASFAFEDLYFAVCTVR